MQDSLFSLNQQENDLATIQVAVPKPLRQVFDYLAPKMVNPTTPLQIGMRVLVPFGRQQLIGVVLNTDQQSDFAAHKIKHITEVIDHSPCIQEDIIELLTWVSRYYQHPIGEVFSHALPALLRQGKPASAITESAWQLTVHGQLAEGESLGRAIKQRQILEYLKAQQDTQVTHSASNLNQQWDNWRDAMKRLEEKGLVEQVQQSSIFNSNAQATAAPLHTLNSEQQQAADSIIASLGEHQAFVLEGITGSVKPKFTCRQSLKFLNVVNKY